MLLLPLCEAECRECVDENSLFFFNVMFEKRCDNNLKLLRFFVYQKEKAYFIGFKIHRYRWPSIDIKYSNYSITFKKNFIRLFPIIFSRDCIKL